MSLQSSKGAVGGGRLTPSMGRHPILEGVWEMGALSLELCLPSLIHLFPSLGLAGMSADTCKLLISEKSSAERQNESLKRKTGAACVWTLGLSSTARFSTPGSIIANSLHPALWEVRWLLGSERQSLDSQARKQHEGDLVLSLWKLLIFPFPFSSSGKAAGFEE